MAKIEVMQLKTFIVPNGNSCKTDKGYCSYACAVRNSETGEYYIYCRVFKYKLFPNLEKYDECIKAEMPYGFR